MQPSPAPKPDEASPGRHPMRNPEAGDVGRRLRLSLLFCVLAYVPVLAAYGLNLWQRGHYQFFPLAVLGALLLARRRLAAVPATLDPLPNPLVLAVLAVAWLLFAAAGVIWSPWLGYVSGLVALAGFAGLFGGRWLLGRLAPSFLMLAVLITPPLKLDSEVALQLRNLAIAFSSRLLDLLDVPHMLSGAIIEVRGHRLLVEEACSGIVSVFFIAAFALFHGLWNRRPAWRIGLVAFAGVSFVVLGNVLRITLGAYLSQKHQINVLTGWPHELFGALLLLAYVGLVISADAALPRWPRGDAAPNAEDDFHWLLSGTLFRNALRQVLTGGHRRFPARRLALVSVCFLLAGAWQGWTLWRGSSPAGGGTTAAAAGREAVFAMPEQIGAWQRVGDAPQSGLAKLEYNAIHSKTWSYRRGAQVCMVAVSYPYPEYHDLSVCYVNSGWELGAPLRPPGAGGDLTVVEYDMTKKPVVIGFLLYGGFNDTGEWRAPRWSERILNRVLARQPRRLAGTHYMVQLLAMNYHPLSPGEKAEARQLFLAAREAIKKQALAQRAAQGAAKP